MKMRFLYFCCPIILVIFLSAGGENLRAEPLEIEGVIEPHLIVKVGSPVAGILKSVKVDRGDMVKEGQIIAALQSEVERASMELARARADMESSIKSKEAALEYNQRKEKRLEELEKRSVIPFEEMDEAKTNTRISVLELEEAKDNKRLAELELVRSSEVVKRMTIYSPIKGVVMNRFLTEGEYVEDQPIVELAQLNPLNVEIFVNVELLGKIKVGMTGTVNPERPGSGSYEAKVTVVDRVVDAASGLFGVRLELPNPDYKLSAGLKCSVLFEIE
jgi:RND family efflux transporter MFP subunit